MEIITIREYIGNDLESTRQAIQYSNGRIELIYQEDEDDNDEQNRRD